MVRRPGSPFILDLVLKTLIFALQQSNNIKVVCRFRPPNALELRETGGDSIIVIDEEGTNVKIKGLSGADAQGFTFDRAFQMDTKQVEVFEYGVKSIVDVMSLCPDVMDGYNGTVFAYGQTGSGKSHTMMVGPEAKLDQLEESALKLFMGYSQGPDIDNDDMKGIIPRITEQIFQSIMASPGNIEYLVKVSYMEIYMERIRDLLAPQNDNLPIHEDKAHGVYVKGLADFYVSNSAEVFEVMRQGGNARAVSSTNMNAESSRSHSVFVITIQARNVESGTQKTGTLYLVDLAGSEKVGKTGASGQTLEEAKKINKSLSALGMVINALTDGKSSHVPYRDSKLTRILQESLGGNSRTTLIINCSPSAYNQDETISTLRFGMRAKSIKNKARVNAELSPAELKQLLKKAQRDTANAGAYIALLEAEINVWRSGGKVDEDAWASMEKALGLGAGELEKLVGGGGRAISPAGTGTLSGKVTPTPRLPALDRVGSLAEGDISRPMTPLGQDERDDFLRRENELGDLLAKTESQLSSQEKLIGELRDELSTLKEQETLAANENKSMASELSDLRLQVERLVYESKEGAITTDSLKDQNAELSAELEELKKTMSELKVTQKSATQEGKDKKKAEKMAAMMAGLDAGGMSEKEAEIRASLARLDEASTAEQPLSAEDLTTLRRQLEDSHSLVREHQERSKRTQEENEILTRRKDELEARLAGLEAEYEELLDKSLIEDERGAEADVQEIKHKLETQYAMKLEAAVHDASDLRQQLELKSNEVKTLTASTESLRSANAELERAFKITAAGIEGGQSLAESAKDMERVRKSMAAQLAEFDTMKKNLMKDLQNRCERVVELEISLDETQEQYKNVLKNSNSKIQQRKMDFLTRNLDQLTAVQKELVEQNSLLKKGCAVAERKLIARNEHIRNLEVALQEAKDKVALESDKFEEKLRLVRARLDHAKGKPLYLPIVSRLALANKKAEAFPPLFRSSEQQQQQPTLNSSLSFGRIAKPLRGGGAAGAAMGPARVDSSSSLAKATSGFFARPSSFFGASPAR
ncbi:BQ5605_C010g06050 [Microbotryum silenes-dioicae]|uniref:BQ5605_C010g06050 protein n=1 Tax=Microbotryum silenes-dioicae TaxID=796604 RepID=A0A2X0LQC0_9BASI|nr:BQ5605_C010g06050 [Microbotryum silenes-dioicae]